VEVFKKEAPSLGKPVLVMRDTTERPEAVEAGTVLLVGTNEELIVSKALDLLNNNENFDKMSKLHNPYGDGLASKRIVDFYKKYKIMNPEVVTIGLGYIGLPTSALIASHGTNVLGVDINQSVVDTINQGKIHIVEPDLDAIVSKAFSDGFFKASTKASSANVYLIVVPTPFKGNHEPDISFVEAATKGIIPLLKKGDLYIIESTSPIGTTDKMQKLIFASRPELDGAIHVAYCPERVLPGNVMHELVENDRVIGGVDEASTKKAISFYRKYVKVSCMEQMLVLLRCVN
jgi:UDP-N-acetyl-D-mannosaminuronate dehydrogenase